ncbi:MAG: 50S ribosomal protein L29 [Elusimicrobia bacterium RIFCSPHIGHO2_02_FULL_57_9]|nr:MAG: 50S ribosomal protein L29 [Elusimicrobia bacterium RIFCSPHIGHO2_02_FULL_57_9]
MKANERQAKRSLSVKELEAELCQAREKSFKLRFKHQFSPLANPLELKNLRRHVARLKTWMGEKQAASLAEDQK